MRIKTENLFILDNGNWLEKEKERRKVQMRKKKMITKKVITLNLCMMMLLSVAIVAEASTLATNDTLHGFHFVLTGGGEKKSSNEEIKLNTNDWSTVQTTSFSNTTEWPLYFRIRSGTNDTAATGLYNIWDVGTELAWYLDDTYGLYNYPYYIRIQTDSTSSELRWAIAEGKWQP